MLGSAQAATPAYAYGLPLDIHKVVSISEPPGICGLVTERLTYEDARGARHTLDYRKWSNGCGILEDGGLHGG